MHFNHFIFFTIQRNFYRFPWLALTTLFWILAMTICNSQQMITIRFVYNAMYILLILSASHLLSDCKDCIFLVI